MANNLLEQTTPTERFAIAVLFGAENGEGSMFRDILRRTPALPGIWTMGEAARAALRTQMAHLEALAAARAVTEEA